MIWLTYAIVAAIVWGLDYSLGEKIFNAKISPISLLAIQMVMGSIFFLIVGLRGQLINDVQTVINNKQLFYIFLAALITFNAGNLLIFLSIQAKNATLAGLIELVYPIFTVIFTWLLFRINHANISTIIGGMLIFAGVLVISLYDKN